MYLKKMGQVFALQLAAFLISQPTYASWFGGSGFSGDSIREEKEKTPQPYSAHVEPFQEEHLTTSPLLRRFSLVVVVNKAERGRTAQTIRIYDHGRLIVREHVSTGREIFEMRSWIPGVFHGPKKSYWSITPTGYFTSQWLSKDHESVSWNGTEMPWAIFIDIEDGIALHAAPKGTEDALGGRASGGCIRLRPALAEWLFNRVFAGSGASIPRFTQDGELILDSQGQVEYSNRTSIKEPASDVIFIVENVIE